VSAHARTHRALEYSALSTPPSTRQLLPPPVRYRPLVGSGFDQDQAMLKMEGVEGGGRGRGKQPKSPQTYTRARARAHTHTHTHKHTAKLGSRPHAYRGRCDNSRRHACPIAPTNTRQLQNTTLDCRLAPKEHTRAHTRTRARTHAQAPRCTQLGAHLTPLLVISATQLHTPILSPQTPPAHPLCVSARLTAFSPLQSLPRPLPYPIVYRFRIRPRCNSGDSNIWFDPARRHRTAVAIRML